METLRKVLRSKIHRAVVTQTDLNYQGSITLPPDLMRAASLSEYEAVQVWNITGGSRFETYAIKGEKKSGGVCVNGAAAKLAKVGDLIIIMTFELLSAKEMKNHKPKIIQLSSNNQPQ